jgi:hypothetical protein
MKQFVVSLMAAVVLVATVESSRGADFVSTALAGFPTQTLRVEYSSPSKLRKLSNYQSLRQRFVGQRLQQLVGSLAQLSIHEDDIDDLMIGWKPGDNEMDLYGFASGHFDRAQVANRAAAQNITPTPISGQVAYCLQAGVTGTCVVILENSLGAFGPLGALTSTLEAHAGQAPGLSTDQRFASLLSGVQQNAAIWGIALGSAVSDWFAGWLATQNALKLDWSKVFEKVDSLTYSIDAADKINMDLKLNCQSSDDAATLRTVMEGVKMAQQLSWQAQNPGHANPYQAMNVSVSGNQIAMQITMAYSDLQLASGVGVPAN